MILYEDAQLVVCCKPRGVLSAADSSGQESMAALLAPRAVFPVHRLDRAVSGLMVLARGAAAASELSRQVREGEFEKHYMAVVHGEAAERATLTDLLYRDKARKMTFVTDTPAKGVQEAVLDYERVWYAEGLSKVYITLYTGRTHQIRVQFASRGLPLIGERKYCEPRDECPLALFSCELGFTHPATGERMHFRAEPPEEWPWTADV